MDRSGRAEVVRGAIVLRAGTANGTGRSSSDASSAMTGRVSKPYGWYMKDVRI